MAKGKIHPKLPVAPEAEINSAQDVVKSAPALAQVPTAISMPPRRRWVAAVIVSALILAVVAAVSFELAYAGRVFPGVSADGILLAGLPRDETSAKLTNATRAYSAASIPMTYGKTVLRIPVASLAIHYDISAATDLAHRYGRQGNLWRRAHEQLRALLGRPTNLAAYTYDEAKLTPFFNDIAEDVTTPVVGPSLTVAGGKPQATLATPGRRLDLGGLAQAVDEHLGRTSDDAINAPVYELAGSDVGTSLDATVALADKYLAGPVTIRYGSRDQVLGQATIATWLIITQPGITSKVQDININSFYHYPAPVSLILDQGKVSAFVDQFTASINQTASNAVLAMLEGKLTVVRPSQDGTELSRDDAYRDIQAALTKPAAEREITLATKVTRPDVREDNLDQLGIKELVSEGQTFFPGSPSTRLINVRAGANKFNGVLLKPGEVFSFGALLGDVGPAQGYVPELVILGDHEEKQYGGGLCQVSSTAFRAALNGGMPILQRVNHSFAISYYTAPFGVPGVDATIFYPDVDFKFRNDTPGYILIQTKMVGTTLTFDYYGTKVKSGVIRGPVFVTGTTDETQPSHTIFYRDVLDLSGAVVKTDTFNTFYKSSKDFPIKKQFN